MNFARNSRANILGLMKGLFDFAFGVPHDVFTYNCHVANTVSYQAVRRCLEGLSSQEAKLVMEKGRSVNGVVVMDNVQNYLIQRDARIGRINTMNRGIQSWFLRVVLESVLGSGFRFCCLQNQWLVFAVVFTLVFATRSRTFNPLCQCTRTMTATSAVTTVARVYFHPLASTSTSRPPPSRVDHHSMHARR